MVTARASLRDRHPPELGMPNDQHFIEQTALLKVLDQPGHGLVDFPGM